MDRYILHKRNFNLDHGVFIGQLHIASHHDHCIEDYGINQMSNSIVLLSSWKSTLFFSNYLWQSIIVSYDKWYIIKHQDFTSCVQF